MRGQLNGTMGSESQTTKFLYTIMKQLDMKSVDWNMVAAALGITNGHAARMRYSRFKQQMEGHIPTPRRRQGGSSPPTRGRKPGKGEKSGSKGGDTKSKKRVAEDTDDEEFPPLKMEKIPSSSAQAHVKPEPSHVEEAVMYRGAPEDNNQDYGRSPQPHPHSSYAPGISNMGQPSYQMSPESPHPYAMAPHSHYPPSMGLQMPAPSHPYHAPIHHHHQNQIQQPHHQQYGGIPSTDIDPALAYAGANTTMGPTPPISVEVSPVTDQRALPPPAPQQQAPLLSTLQIQPQPQPQAQQSHPQQSRSHSQSPPQAPPLPSNISSPVAQQSAAATPGPVTPTPMEGVQPSNNTSNDNSTNKPSNGTRNMTTYEIRPGVSVKVEEILDDD